MEHTVPWPAGGGSGFFFHNEAEDRDLSEQTGDPSVRVYIDLFSRGYFGQTGHGHDISGENDHESGSG